MIRKRVTVALIAAAVLLSVGRPALAIPETGQLMARKLWRGTINTFTGWVEVPIQMAEHDKGNGWKGTLTGLGRGFLFAVGRTTTGIYEMVTFPIPIPEDYRPILYPEHRITAHPVRPRPVEKKDRSSPSFIRTRPGERPTE